MYSGGESNERKERKRGTKYVDGAAVHQVACKRPLLYSKFSLWKQLHCSGWQKKFNSSRGSARIYLAGNVSFPELHSLSLSTGRR
ncbi:hypothetical protein CBR_g55 [Chara braunii]|uniref:Uncharacterized protein n=1 Tax=Chara braunii TaxID=69332 RepID=A0A388JLG1_CHABU|nr:hypothetical protein CBR_g55 [Chara braunii]|eukprot:GBG58654.1 hypothetical protein CBR_g55 [Chara braunii]